MNRAGLFVCFVTLPLLAQAQVPFPVAPGTTWKFQMTQEFGEGIKPGSEEKTTPDPDGKVHLPISMFIGGSEKIDGVETLKYELHRQGRLQLTEFMKVDDTGVTVYGRAGADGEIAKLAPPQKILTFPPRVGDKWDYKGKAGDNETTQQYEMVGEESITVPAGTFSAFHLKLTQLAPVPPNITEERWFVPNVGYVKLLTLMTRADGGLLQRITIELTEAPKIGEPPTVASPPEAKKRLHAGLAKELTGEATTTFTTDIPKIFARWQGETLKNGDKIRAVWIAEDVGEAATPNYKLDEATMTATEPRAFGTFTISKPNKGFPPGKYRLDIYDGDDVVESVKFTIEKSGSAAPLDTAGPGKVTKDEALAFAEDLASDDDEAGTISIATDDGQLRMTLRDGEGKSAAVIPAGTKKILLHSEWNGSKGVSAKVVYIGPGEKPGTTRTMGESHLTLGTSKKTEDTWVNAPSGGFEAGDYWIDVEVETGRKATLPYKVTSK